MTEQQSEHFKETSPEKTVEKLLSILQSFDIETTEKWREENHIGTYSLRVKLKGCGETGTNGKGVSPQYARASAYAELFERLQNGILIPSWNKEKNSSFRVFPDERILSADDIVEENSPFFKFYVNQLNYVGLSKKEIVKKFQKNHQWDYMINGKDNEFLCIPYTSCATEKKYNIPVYLMHALYGSNGMCAGNTVEEALVQGISEIIERAVQTRIMREKPCLPDVPSDYMEKYPYIYDIFRKLQKFDGCEVYMKDASFGGKYPVAALVIVEKNTGHFGVKLGCHPDFGIAMERTLTELTQGQSPLDYAQHSSVIDFGNAKVETPSNILNTFMIGRGQYPYQLLSNTPTYKFVPAKDVSCLTNKDLLNQWIEELSVDYDVLIHDVSFLGFPSFHIIIPGLSEMRKISEAFFREENTRLYASYLMKNQDQIDQNNCIYILGALEASCSIVMMRAVQSFIPPEQHINIPFKEYEADNLYLAAMCYIMKKDYPKAWQKIKTVVSVVQHYPKTEKNSEDIKRLKALLCYLQALCYLKDKDNALSYVDKMFDGNVGDWIFDVFFDEKLIIRKQYYPIDDAQEDERVNNLERIENILHKAMENSRIF